MKFSYPRLQFAIRFMVMSAFLVSMIFLLAIPDINAIWLAGFGLILLAAVAIVTLSPMITAHEITADGIILRQGILFKAKFLFSEIESVERYDARLWAFGLLSLSGRNRIVLASANRNLVMIKLREKRRFALLHWRSSREIIIDLDKPDDLINMANDKLIR